MREKEEWRQLVARTTEEEAQWPNLFPEPKFHTHPRPTPEEEKLRDGMYYYYVQTTFKLVLLAVDSVTQAFTKKQQQFSNRLTAEKVREKSRSYTTTTIQRVPRF